MATQRAIPGANLPESGSSIARKGRSGTDFGQTAGPTGSDMTAELPGETGLGSGPGTTTSGFGAGDAFGTTGVSTEAYGQSAASARRGSSRERPA